jgi:sigma-B regulation protein RsbQ
MDAPAMSALTRNNVRQASSDKRPMVFMHGYGCDQAMWRHLAPHFESQFRTITYDLTGCGGSDVAAYDFDKYASLEGHAEDLLEICRELDLKNAVVVAHSVSATIAALAALRAPEMVATIVMICPSPSFIDDGDYVGGFTRADIGELLEFLDSNFLGWSRRMAPVIMGAPEQPELAIELNNSFCQTDPEVAKHFAAVTFLADHRRDFARLRSPSLIVQCSDDALALVAVGAWLNRTIAGSALEVIAASGHCPHLSAPEVTRSAIQRFLG